MDNKLIRAVIYARYSSSGQREESIEGQLRECREYAQRNGMTVVGEYTDKALTGRTDKRPDFQRMLRDSERGAFDVVLCWKIDRFARNRYDSAMYKYRLKKNGVRLEYAKETIPDGPEGIILESVMEGYAEYYSANLSQNIKRGNHESALQCKVLGQRVLGYRKGPDGRFEIDPITAPIVQRIFKEYANGERAKDIIGRLNAEGHRTVTGSEFNKSSFRRVLTNEKYIGIYRFKDVCVEGGVPAIVDRETFDKCGKMVERRRRSPAAKRETNFMLTTKLFCGLCGEPMTGDGGTSKGGKVHHYYTCNNRKRSKCKKERAQKDWIENLVVSELYKLISSDEFISEVIDGCIAYQERLGENAELKSLEQRQKDVQRRRNNMAAAIEQGIITETTKTRLMELESECAQIERSIAQHLITHPKLDRDQIGFFLYKLQQGDIDDIEYRQLLIDTFLNKAFLYDDDKLILVLNYTGEHSKVTLQITENAVNERENECSTLESLSPPNAPKLNTAYFFEKVVAVVVRFVRK